MRRVAKPIVLGAFLSDGVEAVYPDPRCRLRRPVLSPRSALLVAGLFLAIVAAVCCSITSGVKRAMDNRAGQIRRVIENCRADANPHARFGWSVLNRRYWSRQLEVCRSVHECRTTVVPAGNGVGKSHVGSGICLSFAFTRPNSLVFTYAPTQAQLERVLWKEIRKAHKGARIPLGGEVLGSAPIKLELGDGWGIYGHVSNKVEVMSGHHGRRSSMRRSTRSTPRASC
jgi:hypothetical protein